MATYAIVKTGGKQYKVAVGDLVKVEKLEGEPGTSVSLSPVLVVNGAELTTDADTTWGRLTYLTPCVEMSETPPAWLRKPVPLGTHPPSWPAGN